MTSMELMQCIGQVKGSYILEAQEPPKSVRRIKQVWLIAAVIALTLLLVGCAVAYIFRMRDLKVGEFSFYVPTEFDEDGNVIPVERREPITVLSVQRTNMEALAEWTAFTHTYDQDGTIALEADKAAKAGAPWDIPENYRLTYGCYSQEMVDKLNQIVKKYKLKLLSSFIPLNYYENSVLFKSLGIGELVYDTPDVHAEYWDGDFHLEGTFDLNMMITGQFEGWEWKEQLVSWRYSLKEYFDPSTGSMWESQNYTQWDYTRKDGRKVLLVLAPGDARIYADLQDAFITIGFDAVMTVDGTEVPMTREALQQLAELFDLSIKPQPTTMEQVEKYKAEAKAQYEADRAALQAEHEAMYVRGYQEFVNYRLGKAPLPENLSYLLYDLNGDGAEELIIGGYDILSMKDGVSYRYFDLTSTGVALQRFRPCEGNVFEVYCEDFGMYQHYFYQANADSAAFLTGVSFDSFAGTWYLHLKDGLYTEHRQPITEEEAQKIIDSYTRISFQWLPLKLFGKAVPAIEYSDPYAQYIADALVRYENAGEFTYTLMDLNGDGVEELITRQPRADRHTADLQIFTIRNGKREQYADNITYICQENILETCEESTDSGSYHGYYRCGADGPELIEKVVRDPFTLYWGYAKAGQEGHTVRAEEAQRVIDSYQRLKLEMTPFAEYPLE